MIRFDYIIQTNVAALCVAVLECYSVGNVPIDCVVYRTDGELAI